MLKNSKDKVRERKREKGNNRRERERERKKRSRKYGQEKTLHARRGVYSCIAAGVIFALVLVMLLISVVTRGHAPVFIGGMVVVTFFGAWMGMITGFRGFKERQKNYITCKIGVACNIALLVGFAVIFIGGMV